MHRSHANLPCIINRAMTSPAAIYQGVIFRGCDEANGGQSGHAVAIPPQAGYLCNHPLCHSFRLDGVNPVGCESGEV